jgi:arylsulfatase A-like enzyme
VVSDVPSGNIDLTPTVLEILGIAIPQHVDGRVLREAFVQGDSKPVVKEQRHEARRRIGFLEWSQYLKTTEVDGALYFDEGNGSVTFP